MMTLLCFSLTLQTNMTLIYKFGLTLHSMIVWPVPRHTWWSLEPPYGKPKRDVSLFHCF